MTRALALALLLATLTALVYRQALHNPFVYEDFASIEAAPISTSWIAALTHPGRWLSQATFARRAPVDHAVNLGLHLFVGALLGALAFELGIASWWLASALFWLHPLNIEAVAYAASRTDLLMALGVLIACLGVARKVLGMMLLGGLLAMLAKESGVAVVPLVMLTAWYTSPLTLRGFAPVAAVGALAVFASRGLQLALDVNHSGHVAPVEWAALMATATVHMAGLVVWPRGLTIEHDVHLSWTAATALWVSGMFMLGWTSERRPRWAFGLVWALLALAPRFVVQTPLSVLPEHQMYVPMIGICLWAATLLGDNDDHVETA